MKRKISWILVFILLLTLLAGCAGKETEAGAEHPETVAAESPEAEATAEPIAEPAAEPTPGPTPEPTPEPTPSPAPTQTPEVSWSKAFREDNLLSEGSITPEEIAFLSDGEEIGPQIVNVPKEEVLAWCSEQESLPRAHFYEQFMTGQVEELLAVLDYAMAHGYFKACVPTTQFSPTDVAVSSPWLRRTYRINARGISSLNVGSFDAGQGKTLQFITLTLNGMDQHDRSAYREAMAAAREVVADMPEGLSEYERALYLYSWLTENVSYYFDDYYGDDWNLLYDTMVKRKTVCAGYAEAMYVMMNLVGIECITIEGYVYQNGEWGGHIWNVAKIDGEWYQFDATWDSGSAPENYLFFGISDDTLQALYPRIIEEKSKEYCPPCTGNLPLPGESGGSGSEAQPGVLEDGLYRLDPVGLQMKIDGTWELYTREEIAESFYGDKSAARLGPREILRMGLPYIDLMMKDGSSTIQVMMERVPVETADGTVCEDAETYMDHLSITLTQLLTEQGLSGAASERSQAEICGRTYEAVRVSGKIGWVSMSQTMYCTVQDGRFYTIVVVNTGGGPDEAILAKLLG